MNKYTTLFIFILNASGKTHVGPTTMVNDLFDDDFNEADLLKCLLTFEVLLSKDIPDSIGWPITGTIADFCDKVKELPEIPEKEYAEFVRIKSRINQHICDLTMTPDSEIDSLMSEEENAKNEDIDNEYWEFIERVLGRKREDEND